MNTRHAATMIAAMLVLSLPASAIDRRAQSIQQIGIEAASYDSIDGVAGAWWSETAMATSPESWSLVGGAGLEELSGDGISLQSWHVALGVKHYLTRQTGLSLFGTLKRLDIEENLTSVTLELKQRLVDASEPISPHITASLAQVFFNPPGGNDAFDDDSTTTVTVGAGCDFMMTKQMGFVFDAFYTSSSDNILPGVDYPEGWGGGVHMIYYLP